MTHKSLFQIALLAVGGLTLSACATHADPEPYLGFDCEQLRVMSDTRSPLNPFEANRVGPDPQAGLKGDREGLKNENMDAAEKRDDEARAIRAAYRQKGC